MKAPDSKFLVYTSAGDKANLHYWLKDFGGAECRRNFDFWVTYYGAERNKYRDISDFYNERQGGKFANLLYVYQNWRYILDKYQAIFVMDDDIIIDTFAINRLFEIREQFDLWLLQPAFHPREKISHPITLANPNCFMRYTNFVENGCPLFRKDKLDAFMEIYDPILTGWGIDFWYHHVLGENRRKIAIVDALPCINPHESLKGEQREIETLEKNSISQKKYAEIREQFGIVEYLPTEFARIKRRGRSRQKNLKFLLH